MKINRASASIGDLDEDFLKAAFAPFPNVETITILRELVGGKTKATVLLVDITAPKLASDKAGVEALYGQFILKLDQRPKDWPDEPIEPERHQLATDWGGSGGFSKKHIPKLRHHFENAGKLLMLYDIAGLSQLRLSGYQHLGVGVHAVCCGLVSTSLLTELNGSYKTEAAISSRMTLEDWLSYRLDRTEGKRLYEFATAQTLDKSAFARNGRVYLNPLWVCNSDAIATDKAQTRFLGLIHGDLHTGNIFFDRVDPQDKPFWIIDWALSRKCPIFYDQAYFEVSLLIRELSGKPIERLDSLLDAADNEGSGTENATIPQEHMALAASMKELRRSLNDWQHTNEPNRPDSFLHQWLLARVAAGLNWTNKPLEDQDRALAFTYAAKAATDLMRLFHASDFELAIRAADTAASTMPASISEGTDFISNEVWNDYWQQLSRFDETECAFMLVAGSLAGTPERSSLGFLPWAAILDLDPNSEAGGLYASAAEVLNKRRSLSWFGRELIQVNYQRGTAWMMANGWPSRKDDVPRSFEAWRRDYLRKIRELSSELRAGTAPKIMKVVILPGDAISDAMLGRLIEAIDEEFGEGAEFILVGSADREIAGHPLIKHRLPVTVPSFLKRLLAMFGSGERTSCPQLPGLAGAIEIAAETLRNWEEDLEVLHSLVLETSTSEDIEASAFLRGMPPTWQDLAANLDVPRSLAGDLLSGIDARFTLGHNFAIELWHSPGAGGTTAALRAAWDLRTKHPTLILRRFSRLTADRIDSVYQKCQKPVLVIADAADLPRTGREDLFRELGRRNARIGLIYLVRSPRRDADATFHLFDPMQDKEELTHFLETYLPRCKNEFAHGRLNNRRAQLKRIADLDNPRFAALRSPFFFGLTTFEEDFLSLDRYVGSHLAGVTPIARQTILYMAVATLFSQKGLSEAFFRRLFQPVISGTLNLDRILGIGPAKLVVHGNSRLKIIHPLLAEEALRELLGGTNQHDWKANLKDLCVQLIRDVVAIVGPYSDEAKELFTQLFIFRDPWTENAGFGKRQFSPLVEAITTVDGQQQVLKLLTEACPLEPHYWNHLGRHLIYKTNQDYATAEQFLLKAVELSKEEDGLHFHALGMVRRFWTKDTLDSMFKDQKLSQKSLTAESVLSEISDLVTSSLDAFERARNLNPEDEHCYVTPIQTTLMVAERMCQANGYASIGELCSKNDEVSRWLQKRIAEAEDLLARLRHFRGKNKQSEHERKCEVKLTALYGNFDELIETWEKILDGSESQSWLRRAVAHAYLARRGRTWGALPVEELRRIVQLSECNLGFDPTGESDLRTWFQAYRFLPEFSFNEAVDRLQTWAERSDSVDAHYYLYILHFLRWHSGGERDEDLIQKHLKKSAELSVGRRDNSYEWVGIEPAWCPIVNSRELGGWVDQKNFFKDTSKLAFLEGTVSSLKRTAGTIRIGKVTRAFFRPPAHLRESEHLNAQVHFVLGFSYERLHAWLVDLGPSPVSNSKVSQPVLDDVHKNALPRPQNSTHIATSPSFQPVRSANKSEIKSATKTLETKSEETELYSAALALTKSLLDERIRQQKPLTTAVVGNKLRDKFPGAVPVHERLGFHSVKSLVESWPDLQTAGYGQQVVVQYKASVSPRRRGT